jgi:sarcosine oxidase subunit alpha
MTAASDLDLGAEAFRYLDARSGRVGGAPALALRIGFVGELGYEIHVPAVHGEAVWDALLAAGAAHGIRPVGLEPQRQLRLEKLHILVGQDTDSESTPYDAGLSWIVKLDKEDEFVGRWALEDRAGEDPVLRLVGLAFENGHVPGEGAAVVVEGRPAGRVTSARMSHRLGHAVALAWVPDGLAADGSRVDVRVDGVELAATVTTRPFYDPDGERQRA